MVFKTRRQTQGQGVEKGAEVITADPTSQFQKDRVDKRGRFDRLEDVLGNFYLRRGSKFCYDALRHPAPERHPDQLARLDRVVGGNTIRKSAGVADKGADRYFRVSHALMA